MERFWSKVNIRGPDDCWEWTACKNTDGYGHFNYIHDGKKEQRSNRISYILSKGKIPESMVVRHSCDNPSCCNPNHLELGSQSDNVRDCMNRDRFPDRAGESNGRSKLSKSQALAIRNDQRTLREIFLEYGIALSTASRIKRGVYWQDA